MCCAKPIRYPTWRVGTTRTIPDDQISMMMGCRLFHNGNMYYHSGGGNLEESPDWAGMQWYVFLIWFSLWILSPTSIYAAYHVPHAATIVLSVLSTIVLVGLTLLLFGSPRQVDCCVWSHTPCDAAVCCHRFGDFFCQHLGWWLILFTIFGLWLSLIMVLYNQPSTQS